MTAGIDSQSRCDIFQERTSRSGAEGYLSWTVPKCELIFARLRNVWAQFVQGRWFNPHVHLQPRGREGLDADLWTQYDCNPFTRKQKTGVIVIPAPPRNSEGANVGAAALHKHRLLPVEWTKCLESALITVSGASEEQRAAGRCYTCDPDAPTLTRGPWNTSQKWAVCLLFVLLWLLCADDSFLCL